MDDPVTVPAPETELVRWRNRAEDAEDRLHTLEAALRKTDEVAKRGKVGEEGVTPAHHFNSIRRIARAALYNYRKHTDERKT